MYLRAIRSSFALLLCLLAFGANASSQHSYPRGTVVQKPEVRTDRTTPSPAEYDTVFYQSIIEPGFPVQAWTYMGSYQAGPCIHTLIANVSGDSCLEIIISGLADGPLYCFDHTGTSLPGWPVSTPNGGVAYQAFISAKVVAASIGAGTGGFSDLGVFDAAGTMQWSHVAGNYYSYPPSVGVIDSHGTIGIFVGEEDWKLHGYDLGTGAALPGWPVNLMHCQSWFTPAQADIDLDGHVEVISSSLITNDKSKLVALKTNGQTVSGWSNVLYHGMGWVPAVGDVDGDGQNEILVCASDSANQYIYHVVQYRPDGSVKRVGPELGWCTYGTTPSLADMNGDNVPEILVKTDVSLCVCDYAGNYLPGWPRTLVNASANAVPVVGDVDGDDQPEVVIVHASSVHVFNHDGSYVEGFPLYLSMLDGGAVPAIADIDRDGHNEILVVGDHWSGTPGMVDKLWAFDLDRDSVGVTHGRIEWGQFMHDERHSGFYGPPGTGVSGREPTIPSVRSSLACCPNPFNGSTAIRFACSLSSDVKISVYDVTGRIVDELYQGHLAAGTYQWRWDAKGRAGGVYFCRAASGEMNAVVKIVHLK